MSATTDKADEINQKYRNLIDVYTDSDDPTEFEKYEARKATLETLGWHKLQVMASDLGVYPSGNRPSAAQLRHFMAMEGAFVGAVGDNTVYLYAGDRDGQDSQVVGDA